MPDIMEIWVWLVRLLLVLLALSLAWAVVRGAVIGWIRGLLRDVRDRE